MKYSHAFSYVFEDKDWLSKILIAGLIGLIPFVGQLYLMGWMIEIVRRVKAGRRDILPTTHFTYFLTLGLKMFVVGLIYSIPVIILSGILNLITGAGASNEESVMSVFAVGAGCFGSILIFIVQFAVSLLSTYGIIKLAETDQIKACLDFSDAFYCIKNNLGLFVIVELLGIVANIVQGLGVILCLIGAILTVPYGFAVIGSLVGQLWDNLKPYEKPGRRIRGSVGSADGDIIEEAPFTRVQDIEEDLGETAAEAAEHVEDAAEDVLETVEETAEKAEETFERVKDTEVPVIEETAEEAAEAVEDAVDEIRENAEDILQGPAAEAPAEEKPQEDSNNDLPHFE